MAATKSQGSGLTSLLILFTLFGFGLSNADAVWGKLVAVVGVLGFLAALASFRSQKAVSD